MLNFKGIQQGIQQGKIETAKNMLAAGMSKDMVVTCTGLAVDVIEKIIKDMDNH